MRNRRACSDLRTAGTVLNHRPSTPLLEDGPESEYFICNREKGDRVMEGGSRDCLRQETYIALLKIPVNHDEIGLSAVSDAVIVAQPAAQVVRLTSAFPLAGACLAAVSPLQRSIGGPKSGGTAGRGSSCGGQTPGTTTLDGQPWLPSQGSDPVRKYILVPLGTWMFIFTWQCFLHTHEACSATSSKRVHQGGFKWTAGSDWRHPVCFSKGLMLQQAALGVFHGIQCVTRLGEWLLAGACGACVSAALARRALARLPPFLPAGRRPAAPRPSGQAHRHGRIRPPAANQGGARHPSPAYGSPLCGGRHSHYTVQRAHRVCTNACWLVL
jgi:hypothetical protein